MLAELTFLVGVLLPAPLSLLIARLRPRWTAHGVAALSAACAPAIILGYAFWMAGVSILTPQENCGTDACGMILVIAMMAAAAAGGLFVFGWVLGMVMQHVARR